MHFRIEEKCLDSFSSWLILFMPLLHDLSTQTHDNGNHHFDVSSLSALPTSAAVHRNCKRKREISLILPVALRPHLGKFESSIIFGSLVLECKPSHMNRSGQYVFEISLCRLHIQSTQTLSAVNSALYLRSSTAVGIFFHSCPNILFITFLY